MVTRLKRRESHPIRYLPVGIDEEPKWGTLRWMKPIGLNRRLQVPMPWNYLRGPGPTLK